MHADSFEISRRNLIGECGQGAVRPNEAPQATLDAGRSRWQPVGRCRQGCSRLANCVNAASSQMSRLREGQARTSGATPR